MDVILRDSHLDTEERDCTKARICRNMGGEREAGEEVGNNTNDSS